MYARIAKYVGVFLIIALVGLGCRGGSQEAQQRVQPTELNYWRVFDGEDDFTEIIERYRQAHPHVTVNYRKLRTEEYERALLEAFAEDRGPDLFSIHNTWVGGYASKILPMPETTEVVEISTTGSLKKERVASIVKEKTPSISKLQKAYIPVVMNDVVRDVAQDDEVTKEVLGLPLSVDTMVMFYNNDILAQAGIPEPPQSWEEFQNAVKAITKIGADDTILQSGAGLGTAANVNRSADIVSLLMMQNGAQMTDQFGRATFHQMPAELAESRELPPGLEALVFYTEFANPLETVYTWNARMPDSFSAFANGRTAFFFGYKYHIPLLATQAPKLNYDYATIPQLNPDNSSNFASYWVETVSKKTEFPNEAWDFLLFMSDPNNTVTYLEKTGLPTAHRAILNTQLEDPELEPFVSQLLTAKSWYKGKDSTAMETIMHDMIEEALANAPIDPQEAFENAISRAISRLNQTL